MPRPSTVGSFAAPRRAVSRESLYYNCSSGRTAEEKKNRERESKRENEILFSRYEAQCVRPLTHLTTQRPRLNPFFCLCFALIFPNATSLLTSFARALHTAPLLRARFFFYLLLSLSLSFSLQCNEYTRTMNRHLRLFSSDSRLVYLHTLRSVTFSRTAKYALPRVLSPRVTRCQS